MRQTYPALPSFSFHLVLGVSASCYQLLRDRYREKKISLHGMRTATGRLVRRDSTFLLHKRLYEAPPHQVAAALWILSELGVRLRPQKTRLVHLQQGFEFLGYKIKRGKQLRLPLGKIRSAARSGELYAYPREKSIQRFKDQVRQLTKRRVPLTTKGSKLNPVLRGWGQHYKRAHVRMLFNRLDRWIVHRIWSHRFRRWQNCGRKMLPVFHFV